MHYVIWILLERIFYYYNKPYPGINGVNYVFFSRKLCIVRKGPLRF